MSDRIVEQVIAKYQQRSEVGIQKYGTTLQDNNKDNFLKHLQEELMDGSLYVEKLQEQLQTLINLVKTTPNDQQLGEKIRSFVR
jgi:hypothetical protein